MVDRDLAWEAMERAIRLPFRSLGYSPGSGRVEGEVVYGVRQLWVLHHLPLRAAAARLQAAAGGDGEAFDAALQELLKAAGEVAP